MRVPTFLGLIILFALSRFFIFFNPPCCYSDVTADYERYANMWRYGLEPYYEHLYEYPPATIPVLSLPLELDQQGIGKYYSNYRLQILIVDTIFFVFLLFTVKRLAEKWDWFEQHWAFGVIAYILLSTAAKNFWYEGLDLLFTATITTSFMIWVWLDPRKLLTKIISWTFFWLSTAIKFLTAPLLIPLGLLLHNDLKKNILAVTIGFILIWGVPLVYYRSALSVSFYHNNARPIKYASFPSHIIQWINTYTHTEEQVQMAPDFEYVGPVSSRVTAANKVVFPLALLLFLIWSSFLILKSDFHLKNLPKLVLQGKKLSPPDQFFIALRTYGLYVFTLFLTAKIFSQPFHIWYLPLIALLPLKRKSFFVFYGAFALMVLLDTTETFRVGTELQIWQGIPLKMIRDSLRFVPMIYLLFAFFKLENITLEPGKDSK